MRSNDLEHLFDRHANCLLGGRLSALRADFVYPLQMWTPQGQFTFQNQTTFFEALNVFREALLSNGIVRLKSRVIAVPLVRGRFSTIWVEWDHLDADGGNAVTTQVRFVLAHGPSRDIVQIDTMEFPDNALPATVTARAPDPTPPTTPLTAHL